ncbi:MAG: phospholipid scramblase-related protein [Verrucomicrobia bacterium]|nr:phospholipid scramblase-related protein [Verrucomicrobiota bacterium]
MLNRQAYFIREHVGLLKLTDAYDILDPVSKTKLGEAREEISGLVKFFRLLLGKALLPTRVAVYEGGEPAAADRRVLFSLRRGVALFRPRVEILDAHGASLGYLQAMAFSLGGAFRVFTADNQEVALVQGDWKGWNFRFLSGQTELGVITKKWAGLGKELFTTADSYMISINGTPAPEINLLLLAAGLAIDTVLKEKD